MSARWILVNKVETVGEGSTEHQVVLKSAAMSSLRFSMHLQSHPADQL